MSDSALRIKTVTENPPNRETPLEALLLEHTPNGLFYVRSNFLVPTLDGSHRLDVSGQVQNARSFTLADLEGLGSTSAKVTLECAGNARLSMDPVPEGTPWGWGAASSATFGGVPLATVLKEVGLLDGVVEIAFTGADRGTLPDGRTISFERSLPIADALRDDVLLAWSMNGETLPREHGYPLRLVVPRWYGVASVKWVTRIEALIEPLDAHFQTERYIFLGDEDEPDATPVRRMRVRSLIARPGHGDVITQHSPVLIEGVAWSGEAQVRSVEVSVDGGDSWSPAELDHEGEVGQSRRFSLSWTPVGSGIHGIATRATDSSGSVQPDTPRSNRLGYGNNLIHQIEVTVP